MLSSQCYLVCITLGLIERFSKDCPKTNTKVIPSTTDNESKQRDELIKYIQLAQSAGKNLAHKVRLVLVLFLIG